MSGTEPTSQGVADEASHALDLLSNAIDSLEEALLKWSDAVAAGNAKSFKFAVLHFSHFAELLLKHYVASQHPLLIYRDPFARALHHQNTIGLWDAVNFIRNQGKALDGQFLADLEWLKRLRNEIEHNRFEMNILEVRLTLGRLAHATEQFANKYCGFTVRERLGWERFRYFGELKDDYEKKLIDAKAEAKRLAGEEGETSECRFCGNSRTAYMLDEEEGYTCTYCGEQDPIIACVRCLDGVRLTDACDWNSLKDQWMCESCYERVSRDVDDRD